jgi:hypothetical protein
VKRNDIHGIQPKIVQISNSNSLPHGEIGADIAKNICAKFTAEI